MKHAHLYSAALTLAVTLGLLAFVQIRLSRLNQRLDACEQAFNAHVAQHAQ